MFLLRIGHCLRECENKIDRLQNDKAFDVEVQRDIARGCIVDIGIILSEWKARKSR